MPIRERASKKGRVKSNSLKNKDGTPANVVYEVYFNYHDFTGATRRYSKSGFKTKKEAMNHEVEMKSKILEQGDLFVPSTKTVNEVFAEYDEVEASVKLANSTYLYYQSTYNCHIRKQIGERKINSFRYKDMQIFFNKIESYAIARSVYKVLQVIFRYAVRSEYVKGSPLTYVVLNQKRTNPEEINTKAVNQLDANAVDKIVNALFLNLDLSHCPNREDVVFTTKSYAIAIEIGYYTGLRISEVFGLEKTDFDFKKQTFKVQRRLEYHGLKKNELHTVDRLKNRTSRAELPFTSSLKEILEWWFSVNPYNNVISTIDGNYPLPGTLMNRLDLISKQIGLEIHFHLLRHLFITELGRKNVDPNITKKLARHSKVTTTLDIYSHIQEVQEMDAIEKTFNNNQIRKGDDHECND